MEGTQHNTDVSYQVFSKMLNSRQRMLTSEEFLGVSREIGADTLDLYVRIPGGQNPKFIHINWKSDAAVTDVTRISLLSLEGSIVEKVLKTGSEFILRSKSGIINNDSMQKISEYVDIGSVAAFPLKFQGAVTGCICFRTQNPKGFSTSNILIARLLGTFATVLAQWERETDSSKRYNEDLIRWRVQQGILNITEANKAIADIALNILSSAAIVIYLDIGFKSYSQIVGNSHEAELIRKDIEINSDESHSTIMEQLGTRMEIVESDLLDVSDDTKEGSLKVGKFYSVVSSYSDTMLTSGSTFSFGYNIAASTTGAVLNGVRDFFNSLTRKLGLELNDETIVNEAKWFEIISQIAEEASLLWAAVTHLDGDKQYGKTESLEIIQSCLEKAPTLSNQIELIRLDDAKLGKHLVLSLYLPITKARIWLGVEREGFGAELSTLSPWKVFLERLSEISDPALFRLRAQRAQLEAAETRTLATYVVTSQTVFHQISNMTRDIAQPIRSISEALTVSEVKGKEKLLNLVKLSDQSASALLHFAASIMNVNKLDTRRPCLLHEAVDEVISLFDLNLKSNQIHLQIEHITRDIKIDVPFNVVYSTLATLISNAKDAIGKRGGNIKINVEKAEDMIYCHVSNDGLPIEAKIREKLFKLGTTTKMGKSAGGWGLYLAYRSLIENRAYIELSNSDLGETKFTMKFPYVR